MSDWQLGPEHPDYQHERRSDARLPTPAAAAVVTVPSESTQAHIAVGRVSVPPRTEGFATHPVSSTPAATAGSLIERLRAVPSTPVASLQEAIDRWHGVDPDERIVSTMGRWAPIAARLGISLDEYRQHRLDGERWCSFHRDWHEADAFYPHPTITNCRVGHREQCHERYVRRKEAAS